MGSPELELIHHVVHPPQQQECHLLCLAMLVPAQLLHLLLKVKAVLVSNAEVEEFLG